jgi:hypothetical protein
VDKDQLPQEVLFDIAKENEARYRKLAKLQLQIDRAQKEKQALMAQGVTPEELLELVKAFNKTCRHEDNTVEHAKRQAVVQEIIKMFRYEAQNLLFNDYANMILNGKQPSNINPEFQAKRIALAKAIVDLQQSFFIM